MDSGAKPSPKIEGIRLISWDVEYILWLSNSIFALPSQKVYLRFVQIPRLILASMWLNHNTTSIHIFVTWESVSSWLFHSLFMGFGSSARGSYPKMGIINMTSYSIAWFARRVESSNLSGRWQLPAGVKIFGVGAVWLHFAKNSQFFTSYLGSIWMDMKRGDWKNSAYAQCQSWFTDY